MANKYQRLKRQYSTNGGVTWYDIEPAEYKQGNLIQADSPDCNSITWVLTEEYICTSVDDGTEPDIPVTPVTPSYRWVTAEGQSTCQGVDKYSVEKQQVSTDGVSWADTGETRAGTLIEELSQSCGVIYKRWTAVPNDYICEGTTKYYKMRQQYTLDGTTWIDTDNFRKGSVMEELSTDCGVITRWSVVQGEYSCLAGDKYTKEVYEYSTDEGVTWTATETYRPGTLIEEASSDCATPKAVITGRNGTTCNVPDNSDSALYSYEVNNCFTQNNVASAVINDAVTEIGDGCFYYCQNMTSVTFPSHLTSIGTNGFAVCSGFTSFTIPSTVTVIGNYALNGCTGLTEITCLATTPPTIGEGVFDNTNNARICVPVTAVNAYKTAWPQYASRIFARSERKWVDVQGEYVCDSGDKYTKQKEQVQYCGGGWSDTGSTRKGTLVEASSPDCQQ